jgi:sec-independent protein translocase protein TatC
MNQPADRLTFSGHLQELRGRLTWSIAALLIGATIGYLLRDSLVDLLVAPLGQTLYYTSPGGGFTFIIQLCLGFGIIFAVPILFFHIIKFLAPLMPNYSVRLLVITLLFSCLLVAAGVTFAYFVGLPAALYFLSEFSSEQVQALISTDTYMSFVGLYMAGFAILFQLPLLLLIINRVTTLDHIKLLRNTKWVLLGSFIISALITPTPDPFNQAIMAVPVIILYLFSCGLIASINARMHAKDKNK